MNKTERRPFLLFGHAYQWTDSGKLQRIPDERARCPQILETAEWTLRCHKLVGHDGPHQADKPDPRP